MIKRHIQYRMQTFLLIVPSYEIKDENLRLSRVKSYNKGI